MKRFPTATLLALFSALLFTSALFAQQDQTESSRKIVNRLMPRYPEMARTMNLRGVVKAEALVAPNGTVKSVAVKGGHPVLPIWPRRISPRPILQSLLFRSRTLR
jgi:hypothetical protein